MTPTIAILGDIFIDNYWIGTATRISPEAPIPVVAVNRVESFNGGAGNVIANLRALGGITKYPNALYPIVCPTKHRLIVDGHQLARWDEHDYSKELNLAWIRELRGVDGVIISDYGKGAITYEVIEAVASLNLPIFIDSKRSPRDFDIILNPTFFPNEKEYLTHLHDYSLQPKVVCKRGPQGMEYHEFGKILHSYPAYARKVTSVCGAGDTVITAYAWSFLSGDQDPLLVSSIAAAIAVEKPYTSVVTLEELTRRRNEIWREESTYYACPTGRA
jgi:D-beta-D-heptose 7-phosphate kinase/D-beta-D-heptose 1-phosphate adenosyltransferase